MPYNGSGTFTRLYSWVTDAANSINISSSRTDAEMNGFAAGLTNCITRDGQSPPSADLPMGGKKLLNLGDAASDTDALNRRTGDARYLPQAGGTVSGNLSISGTLTASSWVGNFVASGYVDAQTPNSSVSGGVRVRQNATAGVATLEFINSAGSATLAYCQSDGSGNVTFNATSLNITGPLKQGGNAVWTAANLTVSALNTIYGYTPADAAALTATNANVDALKDIPQNAQGAAYTLALTDRGKHISITTGGVIIPANASVAFPIGATVGIYNNSGSSQSISITSDTLTLAGTATTGTRTLAQHGFATLLKVGTASWIITGAGVS